MNLKLFAVLLGGRAPGCHIELHDVVFIVSPSLEEAYPRLVHKWFGTSKRLHIDSSVELSIVDGHEIILSKEKPDNAENTLYFVNFGGYKPGFFGELHEVGFYVTNAKPLAVAKAKNELCAGSHQQHCDDNLEIAQFLNKATALADDVIAIEKVDNYFIHLKPTSKPATLCVESHYRRLDVPEIIEKAKQLGSVDI
ncbi:MAG: DUF1543 domain-containing protein [Proteobacteria bacterium]|nr:DUF1543 domain-containing protein [Pseudomonadota bacterium]